MERKWKIHPWSSAFIMKKLLLTFLILPLILYTASAIEECKGTITQDESPCLVLLPKLLNSNLVCENESITIFFNASTILYSQQMDTYTPFLCNATFNSTILGTHSFNYSTGDSGSIIVEKGEDNMIAIILSMGLLIAFFVGLGLWNQGIALRFLSFGMATIELIMMVALIYFNQAGEDIVGVLRVNFWVMLFVGFGIAILSFYVMTHRVLSESLDNKDIQVKWNQK